MTRVLGQPCWRTERVAEVITTVAKTDSARVHDFLATHAPVLHITDERQKHELSEEELHRALWDRTRLHTLAVVFGDPGTGKSHLIHWLKLRCEQALAIGALSDVQPVLIQRRTGSLKDALEQMVEQLPAQFRKYLEPIQRAIGNISQTTARQLLAQKLALELGTLWRERNRPALPRLLSKCAELCASTGTRDWLCRDGGVIDRNVRRLTQASSVDERTSLPEFTPAEFDIPPRHTRENTPAVRELLDELEDSPELVAKLVETFNLVLRDALNEMSGLGGARLRDLFDQIRLDLKKSGRTLALYVEDVSVMSSLDKELFHAVEPQSRSDLCPMVAVLGMTHSAKKMLAENETQRITHQIAVGETSLGWARDQEELARFAARYLNAVRLDEASTRKIAQQRRTGGNVTVSACTDCPTRGPCHERFGSVEIDSVAVGMFPLTKVAPKRLLDALDDKREREGVRPNPRGFLEHLLRPLLKVEDFEQHAFPRPSSLPLVPRRTTLEWSVFETRYCANYSADERKRLKLLAHAWVEDGSEEEVAQALTPLLQPLHLPELPLGPAPKGPPRKKAPPVTQGPRPTADPAPAASESRALKELSVSVEAWKGGAPLHKDPTAKELLYKFLRASLPVEEFPGLPRSEFDRLLNDKGRIQIEGQVSSAAAGPHFSVTFPRNDETADLILALARAEHLGKGEWNFSNAEHHKRVVARWLRRHGERVLRSFQPQELDPAPPLQAAVQLLGVAAMLRRRTKLPQELPELVRELLAPLGERPASASTSGEWKKLLDTLHADHEDLRRFVFGEINVPQGSGGGVNFINPLPLIQAARAWLENSRVVPPAPAYFERFWKTRYAVLERAGLYARLQESLEPERAAVRTALKSARDVLAAAGLPAEPAGAALTTYCEQLLALRKSVGSNVPDHDFDAVKKEYATPAAWARALDAASAVLGHEGADPWLTFDPRPLGQACEALTRAERYVARVAKELAVIEQPLVAQGDPDELEKALLAELDAIGRMDQAPGEAES